VLKFVAMVLPRFAYLHAVTVAIAGVATAAAFSAGAPAIAASIGDWSYSPQTGALGFDLSSAEQPQYFLMANPMRIVVDLPGTAHDLQTLEAQAGGVFTQIRAGQAEEGKTRLVLQLAPGTVLQPGQVELIASEGGRWSLRPLLAEAQFVPEPVAETAPSGVAPEVALSSAGSGEFMEAPFEVATGIEFTQPGADDAPEFSLPSLAAMEAAQAAETETEFVSMEETLERQSAIAAAPMQEEKAEAISGEAYGNRVEREVAWGSSQLPPVPTNIAVGNVTHLAPAPTNAGSTTSLQLPQPHLGQAPFAFSAPERSTLIDPAQVVDIEQLRQSPGAAFRARPPAEVKPAMDPKLLSLDKQPSAALLGGQTGLVLERGRPAARRALTPQPSASRPVAPVPLPVVAPVPVAEQPVATNSDSADEAVPFLVEFGAPLPGVNPAPGDR